VTAAAAGHQHQQSADITSAMHIMCRDSADLMSFDDSALETKPVEWCAFDSPDGVQVYLDTDISRTTRGLGLYFATGGRSVGRPAGLSNHYAAGISRKLASRHACPSGDLLSLRGPS